MTQEALEPSAGLTELEEWHALPERLDAAHRHSTIEAQLPGRVWQDLNNAKDNLCSRMHIVKMTLYFVLDLPKALQHAKSALKAFAKAAGSIGRRFDSTSGGRRRRHKRRSSPPPG